MTSKVETAKPTPLTHVLDSIDRSHARLADRAHAARNAVREALVHGLDKVEKLVASARKGLTTVDKRAADGIIRAQGAVGAALEKARHARSLPGHVSS